MEACGVRLKADTTEDARESSSHRKRRCPASAGPRTVLDANHRLVAGIRRVVFFVLSCLRGPSTLLIIPMRLKVVS